MSIGQQLNKDDATERMDRKWFRLDLPPEDRLVGAVWAFIIFAVAHRVLTGSPPPGMPAMDLALFYTGFLLFPVLGSLLAATLLWFAGYIGCLLAGVSERAPSFTGMLLGTYRGVWCPPLRRLLPQRRPTLLHYKSAPRG